MKYGKQIGRTLNLQYRYIRFVDVVLFTFFFCYPTAGKTVGYNNMLVKLHR